MIPAPGEWLKSDDGAGREGGSDDAAMGDCAESVVYGDAAQGKKFTSGNLAPTCWAIL